MAKIVKTQEVEINLEEVIRLIKKNWNLLADCISYEFLAEREIIWVEASFKSVDIGNALRSKESLVIQINELEGAITDIFREIGQQNPHFKNMTIGHSVLPHSLNVSFEIVISVTPVMPIDPLDIESDDLARANPNRAKQAEIMQLVR